MAFGTGSAVAHRAVDAVMGPRTIQHEAVVSEAVSGPSAATSSLGGSDACGMHTKAFQDVCPPLSLSIYVYTYVGCLFISTHTCFNYVNLWV